MAGAQESWASIRKFIDDKWDKEVIPSLEEYIKIPNQSPMFDKDIYTNGLQEKAMAVLTTWLQQQDVKGMKWELLEEAGKTPFLVVEIDGTEPTDKTLLMYGHMDKQPPLLPWAEGLDPYTPVIRGDKLYGRGGADDGYSLFASILSVSALQREGIPHSRIFIMIEGDEESGSASLPYWLNRVKERIGDVDLLVVLDSGCLSYDRLWLSQSLRGVIIFTVETSVQFEGMHSGIGGGVIPDSTRILRHQLDNIEDSLTGDILLKELHCPKMPPNLREDLKAIDEVGYEAFVAQFPFRKGVRPEGKTQTAVDLAIRNFWMPSLTVVGQDGIPSIATAGNVLREFTRFKVSIRVPPHVNADEAAKAIKEALERDPPNGATVVATYKGGATGWAAPQTTPWLAESLEAASQLAFSKPAANMSLGGTIPFINMLGEMFPQSQFVITGLLGPQSNAHGPNEFLHIPYGKGINYCMARVVSDHFVARQRK